MFASRDTLVSVCVVTYKSSPFIVETLDSIKAQTYPHLELMVSDDCSPDDTVEVCSKWLAENGNRFVRTQLLTTDHNTGVSANANRAFRAARGTWIKILAGDDKLLPDCIEQNIRYVEAHPEAEIVFSNMRTFGDTPAAGEVIDFTRYFERLNADEFRHWQMVYNAFPAPASFMRKTTYEDLGGFEESIPFMEDKPFWHKALHERRTMACFEGPTVAYRIHGESLVQKKKARAAFLRDSDRQGVRFFLRYMRKESWLFWWFGRCLYAKELTDSVAGKLFYALRLLNPYYYYFKQLKKRLR